MFPFPYFFLDPLFGIALTIPLFLALGFFLRVPVSRPIQAVFKTELVDRIPAGYRV